MTFLILIAMWLIGIWLGSWIIWPLGGWAIAAVVGVSGGVLLRHRLPLLALGLAALGFLALGGGRYQLAQPTIDDQHVAFYNGREVVLTGQVVDEPDIRDRSVNVRVAAETLVTAEGETLAVTGDVLVQTPRFPILTYGTQVEISGRLQTPPEDPEFSYRDYLAQQDIHSLVTWPRVQVTAERVGHPFYHFVYDWKARAQETIRQLIPAPESGLLSGILLGVGHAMPPDLDEDFRTTGITHIVVISG